KGRADRGSLALVPLRPIYSAIQQGQAFTLPRAPLPGDVTPDTPVVIVIGRNLMKFPAAPSHADGAGSMSDQAGDDVAGDELVTPQLDRREITVGRGLQGDIDSYRPRGSRRAAHQMVDPTALGHRASPHDQICPGSVDSDPLGRLPQQKAVIL